MKLTVKTIDIFVYLGKNTSKRPPIKRMIAKNINSDFAHLNRLVNNLINQEYLYEEVSGRVKKIRLTDKGRDVFNLLFKLEELGFIEHLNFKQRLDTLLSLEKDKKSFTILKKLKRMGFE